MRIATAFVRLLGRGELTAQALNLADLVVTFGRAGDVDPPEVFAHTDGVSLGLLPPAGDVEYLRPMDAAYAGEDSRRRLSSQRAVASTHSAAQRMSTSS